MMKKKWKYAVSCFIVAATITTGIHFSSDNSADAKQNHTHKKDKPVVGDYEILFNWNHLDWNFKDREAEKVFIHT
jgi:hypothetical protein